MRTIDGKPEYRNGLVSAPCPLTPDPVTSDLMTP